MAVAATSTNARSPAHSGLMAAKSLYEQDLPAHAPARSRTWIYRLGGWLARPPKRLDLWAATGDSAVWPDLGSGRIGRDPAGFGQRNGAAAQTSPHDLHPSLIVVC